MILREITRVKQENANSNNSESLSLPKLMNENTIEIINELKKANLEIADKTIQIAKQQNTVCCFLHFVFFLLCCVCLV